MGVAECISCPIRLQGKAQKDKLQLAGLEICCFQEIVLSSNPEIDRNYIFFRLQILTFYVSILKCGLLGDM